MKAGLRQHHGAVGQDRLGDDAGDVAGRKRPFQGGTSLNSTIRVPAARSRNSPASPGLLTARPSFSRTMVSSTVP